jgi:allantoate deiminase
MNLEAYAAEVMRRCDKLAECTDEPGRITRLYGTPALARANALAAGWMRAAGLHVRQDALGNLVARLDGPEPGAPTLLLGSHLDSVRDAGRYDGPLGVLVALAALERLRDQGARLPFAVELLAFADEEGVRYHTTYLGSSAFAGTLDQALLERTDDGGVRLADAVHAFGGDPGAIPAAPRGGGDLLGYCEVHIEQGPVLEALGLPVGVVTAIAAQSRVAVRFAGVAGHAGTVPIELRRDALCAAAELVLAAEAEARATPGLVATVGQISAQPGASNVIPGLATLSLDVRHQDGAVCAAAGARLRARAEQIAAARRVELEWRVSQESPAVACAPELAGRLAQAVQDAGYALHRLPSGAGHDGAELSAITPFAMLFVRCKGGVSHNPAESVELADVAVAIGVLGRFLELTAAEHTAI